MFNCDWKQKGLEWTALLALNMIKTYLWIFKLRGLNIAGYNKGLEIFVNGKMITEENTINHFSFSIYPDNGWDR